MRKQLGRKTAILMAAICTVGAAGAVALIGGSAEAATSNTVVKAGQMPVPAGGVGHLTLSCPAGKKATGGGFNTSLPDGVEINFSIPIPSLDAWYFQAKNWGNNQRTIDVRIYCSNTTAITREGTVFGISPKQGAELTFSCPAGSTLIGGGYEKSSTIRGVTITSNTPTAQGWKVRAFNNTSSNQRVVVIRLCALDVTGQQVKVATAQLGPNQTELVSAVCPAGKVSTSGGWRQSADTATWILEMSRPQLKDEWVTRFNNVTSSTVTVSAAAVCVTGT